MIHIGKRQGPLAAPRTAQIYAPVRRAAVIWGSIP